MKKRIAAMIVSAGFSSRMGSFKPLLKIGEQTILEKIIRTYEAAGIEDIYVITGYRGDEIQEKLSKEKVFWIQNDAYQNGMFTSVKKGLEAMSKETGAFFMQPVDIPFIKEQTISQLKKTFEESGGRVLYPTFDGEKGHPTLVSMSYRGEILSHNGDGGLRSVLERHPEDAICIPFHDEAVLLDMDTPEDFEKMKKYHEAKAPSRRECRSLMDQYNVPEHIIKHCQEVRMITEELLYSLEGAKLGLDEDALLAAASLHDIARTETDHAKAGAEILRSIGYPRIGNIVETHMNIMVDENVPLNENELLYLADKLVHEDRTVSLQDRFCHSIRKFKENPKAAEKIKARWEMAEKIMGKIKRAQEQA